MNNKVPFAKKKDKKEALKFLENENHYQSCAHLLVQNKDWANFFFPLIDEERQVSLFFGNKNFQDYVFGDVIHYKHLLEISEHNKLCNNDLLNKIQHVLKKMRGINLDDFGNTVVDTMYVSSSGLSSTSINAGGLADFFNKNNITISNPTNVSKNISKSNKKLKCQKKK